MSGEGSKLLAAAQKGDTAEVVRLLKAEGANALQADGDGRTALHAAAAGGNVEMISALLTGAQRFDAKASFLVATDKFVSKLFFISFFIFIFIQFNFFFSFLFFSFLFLRSGCTAVHLACMHNQVEVLRKLLDEGAGADTCGSLHLTPAHMAAACGSVECLAELARGGAGLELGGGGGG